MPAACKQCGRPLNRDTYVGRGFCDRACRDEFERPVVGKACTYAIGSDYYPMTIVAVSASAAKVTVRADRALGGGKFDAAQGEPEHAHRTLGGWYRLRRSGRLYIGERRLDLDPSF